MGLGPNPLSAPFSWPPTSTATLAQAPLYVPDIPEVQINGREARKHRGRSTIYVDFTFTVTEYVYMPTSMATGEVVSMLSTNGVSARLTGVEVAALVAMPTMTPVSTSGVVAMCTLSTPTTPIGSDAPVQGIESASFHREIKARDLAKRHGDLSNGAIIGIVFGIIGGMCILWAIIIWLGWI